MFNDTKNIIDLDYIMNYCPAKDGWKDCNGDLVPYDVWDPCNKFNYLMCTRCGQIYRVKM